MKWLCNISRVYCMIIVNMALLTIDALLITLRNIISLITFLQDLIMVILK